MSRPNPSLWVPTPVAALILANLAMVPAASAASRLHFDPRSRDAIARVAYAEAADQGDSGLAGVVFTIINRLDSGAWGPTVQAVVNAPRQFEPVMRAGGDWRRLPEPNEVQRAHIETILNLALDGRLPDPTHGARYFQNPRIVAARAARGDVSPRLVDFGGAARTAVIGGHVFYARRGINTQPLVPSERPRSLFVGEPRAPEDPGTGETIRGQGLGQAIFVASDGAARAAPAPP